MKNKKVYTLVLIFLLLLALATTLYIVATLSRPVATTTQQGQTVRSDKNVPVSDRNPASNSGGIYNLKDEEDGSNKTSADTTPSQPIGSFVSNHKPNLSGSPRPNNMSSTCTTSPGAICTIEFRMGAITKKLGDKIADSSGNAYWYWTLQEIGLTEGSWDVRAVARINNRSSFTEDAMDLVVAK